jgi:PelA/Pel-15E family pectate lyase
MKNAIDKCKDLKANAIQQFNDHWYDGLIDPLLKSLKVSHDLKAEEGLKGGYCRAMARRGYVELDDQNDAVRERMGVATFLRAASGDVCTVTMSKQYSALEFCYDEEIRKKWVILDNNKADICYRHETVVSMSNEDFEVVPEQRACSSGSPGRNPYKRGYEASATCSEESMNNIVKVWPKTEAVDGGDMDLTPKPTSLTMSVNSIEEKLDWLVKKLRFSYPNDDGDESSNTKLCDNHDSNAIKDVCSNTLNECIAVVQLGKKKTCNNWCIEAGQVCETAWDDDGKKCTEKEDESSENCNTMNYNTFICQCGRGSSSPSPPSPPPPSPSPPSPHGYDPMKYDDEYKTMCAKQDGDYLGCKDADDDDYWDEDQKGLAETLLKFQTGGGGEIGGWVKNCKFKNGMDKGEYKEAKCGKDPDTDKACLDNDATTSEIIFLAAAYQHFKDENFLEGAKKGIRLIIDAQMKNGGWGQYWPTYKEEGDDGYPNGYRESITYNDDLHIRIMRLFEDIAAKKFPFQTDFSDLNNKVKETLKEGLKCILKTQIRSKDDTKTVWCANHDRNTHLPRTGRNYELASFSGKESQGIFKYLMHLPESRTDTNVIAAINGAYDWFKLYAIKGFKNPYKSETKNCDPCCLNFDDGKKDDAEWLIHGKDRIEKEKLKIHGEDLDTYRNNAEEGDCTCELYETMDDDWKDLCKKNDDDDDEDEYKVFCPRRCYDLNLIKDVNSKMMSRFYDIDSYPTPTTIFAERGATDCDSDGKNCDGDTWRGAGNTELRDAFWNLHMESKDRRKEQGSGAGGYDWFTDYPKELIDYYETTWQPEYDTESQQSEAKKADDIYNYVFQDPHLQLHLDSKHFNNNMNNKNLGSNTADKTAKEAKKAEKKAAKKAEKKAAKKAKKAERKAAKKAEKKAKKKRKESML